MYSLIKIVFIVLLLIINSHQNELENQSAHELYSIESMFNRALRNVRAVPCKKSSPYFNECNPSFQKLLVTLKQFYKGQPYLNLKNNANKDTFGR